MESGTYALLGVLFGGLITFAVQFLVQRKEDVRHARKLAFDIAIAEWREHFILLKEHTNRVGGEVKLPPISKAMLIYWPLVEGLHKLNPSSASAEEIAAFLKENFKRREDLFRKYEWTTHNVNHPGTE